MSEQKLGEAPPENREEKAEHMKNVNDEARRVPTRPGWKAAIGVLAFIGGFALYITYI